MGLAKCTTGAGLEIDKGALVGSAFGLLRMEGHVLVVITLDFLGDVHQELGLGAKVFWIDVQEFEQRESKLNKSVVDLILYKTIALAKQLGYTKLLLGGSDPKNSRHVYKFLRLLQGSEFLCKEGWIPIDDCMVFDGDHCNWSPQFSRAGRS